MKKQEIEKKLNELNNYQLSDLVLKLQSYLSDYSELQFYDFNEQTLQELFSSNLMRLIQSVLYGAVNYNDDYIFFDDLRRLYSCSYYSIGALSRNYIDIIVDTIIDNDLNIDDFLAD